MRKRPGIATDALVRASIETRERFAGFTIIRSAENPSYWFANCLLLEAEPSPTTYDAWLGECARCFAGVDVKRLVVTWEVPRLEGLAPYDGPMSRECVTVFTTRKVPSHQTAWQPREFVTASDWSDALELITQELVVDGFTDRTEFEAWRFGVYQRDAKAGRCRFWGLWLDGRLVAYTGLYAAADWARFVTPVTHVDYRRRGLFRTLASAGMRNVLEMHPAATIVIAAESGSYAASMYERMGFRAVSEQHAIVAPIDIFARD